MSFADTYEAWWFLMAHPAFQDSEQIYGFDASLDIHVGKVDPETDEVSDDPARNTKTQIWLEAGYWLPPEEVYPDWHIESEQAEGRSLPGQHCHDVDLDCGGDTFEEAIIAMAERVLIHYGDYREEN